MKTLTRVFPILSCHTDQHSRLRPGALMEFMQEMAGADAEALGVGRFAMLEQQLVWVLTRMEVRMERYPAFGESMAIETIAMPNRRCFFPRYFVFRDEAGRQLGCASTLWVLLNLQTRRMSPPDPASPFMPDNRDVPVPMGLPGSVADVDGAPICAEYLPLYTDIDMNGHVNNTRYVDWFCNALGVAEMAQNELAVFTVNFSQEIRPGQTVETRLRRCGDRFSFSGFVGGVRHFDVGGVLRPTSF